ncbi:MAG: hypothetical protein ACJ746_10375 [Bryobacteraceae bacterium]
MHSLPRHSQAVLVALTVFSTLGFAQSIEKIRNDKVVVYEDNLQPRETVSGSNEMPALVLSLGKGTLEIVPRRGTAATISTKPGSVTFEPAGIQVVSNRGSSPLRIIRIDFIGEGSHEHWGRRGLSLHYKVLLENNLVRVYNIFIPAKRSEPQHTHRGRVVVCLAGAELTHRFPDGRTEVSTLKTGEVVWRKGSTHIGQNHSANNFHAIAIEPK